MKKPNQARSAASTEKMIKAVLSLAEEGGLDAVTISRAADRAGVSNGSIFHRFQSRDGLLSAASDRLMCEIEEEMRAVFEEYARADDPIPLRKVVDDFQSLFERRHRILRAFMVGALGNKLLEDRGNLASQNVAEMLGNWLRKTYATTPMTEASIFRLLMSAGTLAVLFPQNLALSEILISRDDVIDDLTETVALKLGEK